MFELALSNEELRFSLVNGSKWVFLALTLTHMLISAKENRRCGVSVVLCGTDWVGSG